MREKCMLKRRGKVKRGERGEERRREERKEEERRKETGKCVKQAKGTRDA